MLYTMAWLDLSTKLCLQVRRIGILNPDHGSFLLQEQLAGWSYMGAGRASSRLSISL